MVKEYVSQVELELTLIQVIFISIFLIDALIITTFERKKIRNSRLLLKIM